MQAQLVSQVVQLWDRYYLAAHGFPVGHHVDPNTGLRAIREAGKTLGRGIIFGRRSFKSSAVDEFVAHVSSMANSGTNVVPGLQKLVDHMRGIIVIVHRAYNDTMLHIRRDDCPYYCSSHCSALGSETRTTVCHRYFDWRESDDELIESFDLNNMRPLATAVQYRNS